MSANATLHPPVPAFGALRGVSEAALALARAQVDAVLAVVIATHGDVARKRGAMALIEPRGVRAGTLAGGGVEARLESAALDVFASGSAGSV
ncbi:MAG: XdhC family protein, partial [Proteobacteria bacterium]|nr:XdhC family protein [Pseudomonadota bacterium]